MSTQDTAGTAREGMTMDDGEHREIARLIGDLRRAEAERDDLAALNVARVTAHALAMARVAELEAIIAGRTTPPTAAELNAHEAAVGAWLVVYEADHAPGEVFYRLPEDRGELDEWRVGGCLGVWQALRWIALGADGRPCAWPEVSRG